MHQIARSTFTSLQKAKQFSTLYNLLEGHIKELTFANNEIKERLYSLLSSNKRELELYLKTQSDADISDEDKEQNYFLMNAVTVTLIWELDHNVYLFKYGESEE